VGNNADPNENDGKTFEIAWPRAPPHRGSRRAVLGRSRQRLSRPHRLPCRLWVTDSTGNAETDRLPSWTYRSPPDRTMPRRARAGRCHRPEGSRAGQGQDRPTDGGIEFQGGHHALGGQALTSAYVQFQARKTHSVATTLTIRGEASDNAATFTAATFNISSWLGPRPRRGDRRRRGQSWARRV
jgi:hypothetical protein